MGLETSTTIAGLNANWPLGSDQKAEGDDHLRLIKSVLKADAVSMALMSPAGVLPISNINVRIFTAPGTTAYVKPTVAPFLKFLHVRIWGAGGGGGGAGTTGASTVSAGGGGGAGGYVEKLYKASDLAASENLVLGTGGNGAGTTNDGVNGGNSTFKGLTAGGGEAGSGAPAATQGWVTRGNGGAGAGGDFNAVGSSGQPGQRAAHGQASATLPGYGGAPCGQGQLFAPPTTTTANFTGTQAAAGYGGNGNALGFSLSYTGLGQKGGNGFAIFTEYF